MQKRKSFFNNEMEQRFSLRKYTIGLCSVCLGFVVIGMGSQTVKADTVNDVEKSSAVQENKAQDTDSANTDALAESKTNTSDSVVAKSNTTPTETKENEAGSVAATAPKTADSNNSASVNTLGQSKSENSSAVAPTSEKTQLQTSQDSSIKVKENNLNTNKSDTPKTVVQPTSLNDENNLRDPDSKDVEVKPKESSNVDTNEQKETSTALPKQPANADTQLAATTSGVQPFVNLAVESDNNDLTPKHETIDSQWTIHYVNQADHKQELKDPTVITMQYERTNTPQSDGKIQYGDWSYVPGSFKQTGTPITVKDSDNPVKQDNTDKNGENMDVFTITAMYPTVSGYDFHNGINGTRLHDDLVNDNRQADTMSKDFYAEYDVAKPTRETVTSQWTIHYVNSADHKQELKAPTVITMQYTRTDTPQSNGKIQYGDWSYVPGSIKQTGTLVEVNGSDNPTKEDNVDKDGKNYDVFSIIVQHPDITGYELHNGTNGVRLSDYLQNDESNGEIQAPTMSKDGYVEYDVAKERSVAVKFVDDQSFDFDTSDHKKQVGQAITLTGHDGDTVNLKLTVPDKYQLADGQQLPTTYTFTAGSGDVTIHLVHKVVQREATVDVQVGLMTIIHSDADDADGDFSFAVTQNHWKQLDDEIKDSKNPNSDKVWPSVKVGTLTGHVNYDLVDNKVMSFADDWTKLNLGGQTYQMPDGTEVVNGVLTGSGYLWGKSLKEQLLKYYPDTDSDYVNRAWHGYLSANKTNEITASDFLRDYLQVGLAGNEANALAKAIGDQAVTAVTTANKTIDSNWLKDNVDTFAYSDSKFSEQNGQLRADGFVPVVGVYIPYVEKTATRTINITTPGGKTTTVKQTATLAKQIDFGKDAHPEWTTSEWTSYDVPTIQGYTVSQSSVAKETVTGTTKDQTVNITYTANDGTQTIVYQDEDGSEIDKQVISGKTDEKVKVTPDVPDGYVLKGEIPTEVIIKPDDTPITVTVEHGKSHVTPDKPVNKGDLIPDTKDKHYPEGLTHNDLNKTVTREITITDPTGKKTTTTQTVTLTRGATVDEVTNEVTYDDWSENGKHTFDKVDVPNVPGYTASGEVPSIAVTPETQSSKVDITYTANTQAATITYIDDTTKTNLDSKEANGKFGQAITFGTAPTDEITNYEKQGYKLVSNNFKPGIKYQNDNKFNIFEVHLVHTYEPVETSQTITETIHYIDVNGKPVAPDYVAKAVIEMTGTRDKVTNSITWNTPSTGHFDEVISPEVPNMTPDKKFIPSRNVQYGDSDITENVVYTSDETSREPEKPNDQGKPNSKTPEKPNKSGNPTSKTSEKSNKSSKEVSKQFGTIAKTTIPEKPIDSRTVDNHVSAKTTTKRELPQTGTTANTGIWTGLVSIITSLGLLVASKKRKKN